MSPDNDVSCCDDLSEPPPAQSMMEHLMGCLMAYMTRHDNQLILQDRLLNPIIQYMGARLWPYILGIALYLTIVTVLLAAICYSAFKRA